MAEDTRARDEAKPDVVAAMMTALLPVHAAATRAALADAAATVTEQMAGTHVAFLFFEEEDGKLAYQTPASETRRRSHRRAMDVLGTVLFRTSVDAAEASRLAEVLDANTTVTLPLDELLSPLVDIERASAAASSLGVTHGCAAAITGAGDRWGALLVLGDETMEPQQVMLLASHIGCACANLASGELAGGAAVGGAARTVFDARKLEAELQRELARAQRYGRDVSICVIEATNLALLRERFGAKLTEQMYERMGEALSQHARDIDIIGAYRESGYTMVLAEAAPAGVEAAAQRLAAAAAAITPAGKAVPGLELHLAVGCATAPADGRAADALFAAAHRRMYGGAAERVA